MLTPQWFQRELSLINNDYFCVFDLLENPIDNEGLWVIRKWKFKNPISRQLYSWRENSTPIMVIHDTDIWTGELRYKRLDMSIVSSIREGQYWARRGLELAYKVDADNARLMEQAEAEEDYIHRYAAKKLWKLNREPTINLSGKEWRK